MITFKRKISNLLSDILLDRTHRECVKIALYAAEDCLFIKDSIAARNCISLIKRWLFGEDVQEDEVSRVASAASKSTYFSGVSAVWATIKIGNGWTFDAINQAAYCYPKKQKKEKLQEYKNCAKLHNCEDLGFPYREQAKSFNLDNDVDLNVFLDFLTDYYPEALIYSREQFMKEKMCKEYLKVIYQ